MNLIIKKIIIAALLIFFGGNIYPQAINNLLSDAGYLDQPGGVITYTIKKEGVTEAYSVLGLAANEKLVTHSYIDGFGRQLENILVNATPAGKDLVSFNRYDEFGRAPKSYLPYQSANSDGVYADPANSATTTAQATFYNTGTTANKISSPDNYPWAENTVEESPLQRILKQGNVGDGFQVTQHYKTMNYRANTSTDAVRKWSTAGTSSATYAANELSVMEGTDENGIVTMVFKDKLGRLILKRQQADEVIGGTTYPWFDTYYIYDYTGNISYVVSPKGLAKMTTLGYDVANVPKLIFTFTYDGKNRLIKKKVPGAAEVYMVYDPLDRLVLVQDGNMRSGSNHNWMYLKYDNAHRVVEEGIYTDATHTSLSSMQSYVDGQTCYATSSTIYFEKRQNVGSGFGYSNQCFPTSNIEERIFRYYTDYDFDYNGVKDRYKTAQSLPGEASQTLDLSGVPTGIAKKILGTSNWIKEYYYYDVYYHLIQVRSSNQFSVSSFGDYATNVVDFSGKILYSKQTRVGPNHTIDVITRMEYDDMGRMQKLWQTNGSNTEVLAAQYEYNPLGQLVDKKLHSTNLGSSFLQSVDLRYNIRGQLTSINNSTLTNDGVLNDETNDVFGMEIFYDQTSSGISNTADYTGRTSAVKWSAVTPTNSTPNEQAFLYSYDYLGRLRTSSYKARAYGGTTFSTSINAFTEHFAYDWNGNFTAMDRKANGSYVDRLTYTYKNSDNDNQLNDIQDLVTSTNSLSWNNYTSTSSTYSYDDNGNLVSDPYKGTTVTYNELNKPTLIQKSSTQKVVFIYDATGVRIQKLVYDGSSSTPVHSYDYIGGFTFVDNNLDYYGMVEGRVRNDGGSTLSLKMEYVITDQQGNARVSFEDNSGSVLVKQENSYYAFGLLMPTGSYPTSPNKRLYNGGSEWMDDIPDFFDYYSTFYREYDPVIGKFNGVDPMSESDVSVSAYIYSSNNPISLNDPMGDMPREQFIAVINTLVNNGGGSFNSFTNEYYFFQGNKKEAVAFVLGEFLDFSWDERTNGGGGGGVNGVSYNEWRAKFEELYGKNASSLQFISTSSPAVASCLSDLLHTACGAALISLIEVASSKLSILTNVSESITGFNPNSGGFYTEPGETRGSNDKKSFRVEIITQGYDIGNGIFSTRPEILIHELAHVYTGIVIQNQLRGGLFDYSGANLGEGLLRSTEAESRKIFKNDPFRIWSEIRSVFWENFYRWTNHQSLRRFYSTDESIDLSKYFDYEKYFND